MPNKKSKSKKTQKSKAQASKEKIKKNLKKKQTNKKPAKEQKIIFKKETHKRSSRENLIILGIAAIAILLIGALIFYRTHSNKTTVKQGVVAVVNGQPITQEEFQKEYDFFFFIQGIPQAYKVAISKGTILNQTINEMLLVDYAKSKGISVSDKEVDAVVDKISQMSNLSIENITNILKQRGFTMNDLKDYYRKNLMITKLINETILPKINVSDEEIQKFYTENNITTPYNETKEKIRNTLIQNKEAEMIKQLLDELRAKATIKINETALSKIQ